MNAVSETSNPGVLIRLAHGVSCWLPWLVLAFLWFVLFKQLSLEWSTNDNYGYGYVVPVLVIYLFARRWSDRPAPEISKNSKSERALYVLLALSALLLFPIRLIQESNPEWRFVSWCMACSIICLTLGLIDYRAGWPWVRHFAFSIAFILTAVPWLSIIETPVTDHLTKIDTATAVFLLNWIGVPAVQNGNVIAANGNLVGVSEACSGIRSLQITVMISLFFGEYYRFPAIRRVILFLLVGAVALTCNLGRTFLLVWISVHDGNSVMEKWHDIVGYCVLAVALAAFWGIAMWMDTGRSRTLPTSKQQTGASDILRPWPGGFIIALAAWLVLIETGTEIWYRSHELSAPAQPAWSVDWPENAPGFKDQPIPELTRAALKYTTGRQATWRDFSNQNWSVFFFRWAPGRTSAILARMHRPEICLPSIGCRLVREEPPLLVNVHGATILFHSYLFEQGGRPLHVWWSLWDGAPNPIVPANPDINGPVDIFRTVLAGQRNLGQQVVEIALSNAENNDNANASLQGLLPELIKR